MAANESGLFEGELLVLAVEVVVDAAEERAAVDCAFLRAKADFASRRYTRYVVDLVGAVLAVDREVFEGY